MEEVRIGDFTKPLIEKPAVEANAEAAAASTKTRLESAEKKLGNEAEEAEETLKPRLSYEDRLKELGVSKEEAAEIIDAVIVKGCYVEDIAITSRIKLRLRTRQYRDTQRTQTYLEIARPVYDNHLAEITSRYALAASLEKLGKDVLKHADRNASGDAIEEAFQQRLTFVDGLAEPTLRLLFQKLWKFDRKVAVVLEEGAIENF